MTLLPTGSTAVLGGADAPMDLPLPAALQQRLDVVGLPALIAEQTDDDWARVAARLADLANADTRASYAAWLRRQAAVWTAVRLPAVQVAALDWPLASVRPQCLDVVGLIIADLRELSPRNRPTLVPAQPGPRDAPPHGTVVAAALLCARVAAMSAPLLAPAEALAAGQTAVGPATRYLCRCVDLAERLPGLEREVTGWAAGAEGAHVHHAVLASRRLTTRLADALEAATRTGW